MATYEITTDQGTFEVEIDDGKASKGIAAATPGLVSMGADRTPTYSTEGAHRVASGAMDSLAGGAVGGPVGAGVGALMGLLMPNRNAGQYATDLATTLVGGKAASALTKAGGPAKKALGAGLAGLLGLEAGTAAGELTRSALDQRMPNPAKMLNTDPLALALAGGLPAVLSRGTQGKVASSGQSQLNQMSKELTGHYPMQATAQTAAESILPAQTAGKKLVADATKKRTLSEAEIEKLGLKISQNETKAAELQKAIKDADSLAGSEKFTAKALAQQKLDELNVDTAKLNKDILIGREELRAAKALPKRGKAAKARSVDAIEEAGTNLLQAQLDKADNQIAVQKVEQAFNDTLKKLNEKNTPVKSALELAQFQNAAQTKKLKLDLQAAKKKLDKTEFLDPALREIYSDVDDAGKFISRLQKGTNDELRLVMNTLPDEAAKQSVRASLLDDFFSRGYDPKTGRQSKLAELWFPSQQNTNSFKGKFAEMYGAEKADQMERILGRITQMESTNTLTSLAMKALGYGAAGMLLYHVTPGKVAATLGGGALIGLMKYNKFVDKLMHDPKAYEAFIKYTDKQVVPTAAAKIPDVIQKMFAESSIPMSKEQVESLNAASQSTEPEPPQPTSPNAPQPTESGTPSSVPQ